MTNKRRSDMDKFYGLSQEELKMVLRWYDFLMFGGMAGPEDTALAEELKTFLNPPDEKEDKK